MWYGFFFSPPLFLLPRTLSYKLPLSQGIVYLKKKSYLRKMKHFIAAQANSQDAWQFSFGEKKKAPVSVKKCSISTQTLLYPAASLGCLLKFKAIDALPLPFFFSLLMSLFKSQLFNDQKKNEKLRQKKSYYNQVDKHRNNIYIYIYACMKLHNLQLHVAASYLFFSQKKKGARRKDTRSLFVVVVFFFSFP